VLAFNLTGYSMNVHPEPEAEDDFDSAPNRLGRALGLGLIVTLLALCAFFGFLFFSQPAARAGEYGEYPGQGRDPHWASKAFGDSGVRIRGKPQYEPYSSYQSDSPSYGHHHHGDRYSRGNHRIKVQPHSHPHHRERGYSSVVHTHAVTHKHVYRPRYTHPRYTHHYRRWRPSYHYHHRPWQEHAWRRYVTVRVPIDRYGNVIPGHGYRLDDYRDPRDRERFAHAYQDERARWHEVDRLARRGYMEQDRIPSKSIDCKPPVKLWGESRVTQANAKKQARIAWSAAVMMEYGAKYADLRYSRRGQGWERCLRSEYNEEGLKAVGEKIVGAVTGGETWKEKCVIVAIPCAPALKPTCLTKNCDKDGSEPSLDDDLDGDGPEDEGPTR
jgi:hypothetical protein